MVRSLKEARRICIPLAARLVGRCSDRKYWERPTSRFDKLTAGRAAKVGYLNSQFLPHDLHSLNHVRELLFRGPARGLAQTAVGGERQSISRREFQALSHTVGYVRDGFDVVAFHVDDADGDVFALGDGFDQLQLGKFPAGHLKMNLVHVQFDKCREHRRILPRADGMAFETSETKMR